MTPFYIRVTEYLWLLIRNSSVLCILYKYLLFSSFCNGIHLQDRLETRTQLKSFVDNDFNFCIGFLPPQLKY